MHCTDKIIRANRLLSQNQACTSRRSPSRLSAGSMSIDKAHTWALEVCWSSAALSETQKQTIVLPRGVPHPSTFLNAEGVVSPIRTIISALSNYTSVRPSRVISIHRI